MHNTSPLGCLRQKSTGGGDPACNRRNSSQNCAHLALLQPHDLMLHSSPAPSPAVFPCLIIVDVQNDYVLPSGALPCPDAEAIVPAIHHAAHGAFFSAGVYLSADDKMPVCDGDAQADAARWPPHCITGTFGAKIHDGLQHDLLAGAAVVTKRSSMSAFGSDAKGETTALRQLLLTKPPSHAVVCGLALEFERACAASAFSACDARQVLRHGDRSRLRCHETASVRGDGRLPVLQVSSRSCQVVNHELTYALCSCDGRRARSCVNKMQKQGVAVVQVAWLSGVFTCVT